MLSIQVLYNQRSTLILSYTPRSESKKSSKLRKRLSFNTAAGSIKRKADLFELPTYAKKVIKAQHISLLFQFVNIHNDLILQCQYSVIMKLAYKHKCKSLFNSLTRG